WVISDAPLSQLDQLIIEQGITAAALIMLKDKAAREARYALSGDFFANLLQGQDDDQFLRQAERLDYKLEQPRQILLIDGVPTDGGSQQSVSKAMELWQEESGNMGLKAWHNDQLVLMLANGETSYGVDVSKALLEILHHPEWQLSIGVGQAYQDATPNRVRQSFLEAREALKVGERLGDKNTAVYPFHTLGIHHWLNHLSPQQIDNNHYMDHIATIVDYDSRHQAELLKTLETFLDNRLSMARTAVDLHIHRNTLNKRLYRIEHLTGVNLENAHVLYNFYAALIVQKLN
ncbi:MAG: helix-turn-helix domain-containing protein, partial [Chloroflexota bacterium]